jgi:hypothetical protein
MIIDVNLFVVEIKKAFVPQFPGFGVEDFFKAKTDYEDYFPDKKSLVKLPTGFVLDVYYTTS